MQITKLLKIAAFLLIVVLSDSVRAEDRTITVVATTGIVADLVSNVGGSHVAVSSLMGPGVDPHLYKASQGDLRRLTDADIIFYNGLHLEGKMTDALEALKKRKDVISISEKIAPERLRKPPEFEGNFDPHIWFDVSLWSSTIPVVVEALSDFRPELSTQFEIQGKQYAEELAELHRWIGTHVQAVPPSQRVLITAHDAFGYFGHAYGFEVLGLQGISTASEYGLSDVKRLADVVIARKIKALFVESSVPERFILSVREGVRAQSHDVQVGGKLYSDALGDAGSGGETYVGMVRSNVHTIVEALK